MAKRGRKPGSISPVMAEKKRHALDLIACNATLSIADVARHVGVSECTMQKWFKQANLVKWF
jgi:transposase-like protein